MTDFPTILYRTPGPHRGPSGSSYAFLGVADADEYDAAIAAGWADTLQEALTGRVIREVTEAQEAIDEISPATRDELEAKARELGVSFNARTKDEVLASRIAEALQ